VYELSLSIFPERKLLNPRSCRHKILGFHTYSMVRRISPQHPERATRFALRFPVCFREPESPTWLEGTTENISYTGTLFLSPSPMAPETTLELRLQLPVGTKGEASPQIRCKGSVVRLEQRNVPETPIAVAVAISNCRIVRQRLVHGSPAGHA